MSEPAKDLDKKFDDGKSVIKDLDLSGISTPRRKKRRMWRKILLIVLIVIIAAAGYWIFEDIRWTRRLEAQLAEYRAAGQPVDIEDFAPPPTPDNENAALAYKKAFELLKLTEQQKDLVEDFVPKKIAASPNLIKAAIDANPQTLKLLHDAGSMTGCDWGMKYSSPVIKLILPDLGPSRKMGKFLSSAAVYYHNTKNDAAAVESVRDMLPLANSNRVDSLIGNLVALAIDRLACGAVEAISKDLTVTTNPTASTAKKHPASRKAVELLIRELLDEKDVRDGWIKGFYMERTVILDTYQQCLKGNLLDDDTKSPSPAQFNMWIFRPWHKRELLDMLQHMSSMVQAAGQTNFSEAKQLLPPHQTTVEHDFIGSFLLPLRAILEPVFNKAFTLYFRSIAQRRMAGIALAIRLYEIDNGRRPAELTQLVPKYLSAVPVDPFSPDGGAIKYRPNLQRPVLYSVGENQTDEAGQYAASPDEPPVSMEYDEVFFLNGGRPREKKNTSQQQTLSPLR